MDRLWRSEPGAFLSRMTGYRKVRKVMDDAVIRGGHASPKGLRHGFGVHAIQSGVPLTLVQRWLGHADIKTTAIYTNVMGPEERSIAARMWKTRALRHDPAPETDWTSRRDYDHAHSGAKASTHWEMAQVSL
jgi:site-specific recombinase XerD